MVANIFLTIFTFKIAIFEKLSKKVFPARLVQEKKREMILNALYKRFHYTAMVFSILEKISNIISTVSFMVILIAISAIENTDGSINIVSLCSIFIAAGILWVMQWVAAPQFRKAAKIFRKKAKKLL